MLLVIKEQKGRLHPQLEGSVDSELLNQLLHLDSRWQLRREVCSVVPHPLQQVDYLVHLLLHHQCLDNPPQLLRRFLELLLRQHREVCSVRLQHLPPLLGRLHLELHLCLRLGVFSEVHHRLLRLEDYLVLPLRRQVVACLVRLPLLLQLEDYLDLHPQLRSEDFLVPHQHLRPVDYLVLLQHLHLREDYLAPPLHWPLEGCLEPLLHPLNLVVFSVLLLLRQLEVCLVRLHLHLFQLEDCLVRPLLLLLVDYLVQLQPVVYLVRLLQLVDCSAHLWLRRQLHLLPQLKLC